MDIPEGIIFGIVAMIGWGTTDFFIAKAVRKTSVFKTFVWSQTIGVILFFLIFLAFFKFPLLSLTPIGIILILGFLVVFSYLVYFKGLQVGKVSIISPVAACWAVVTVILSLIFLNEMLTALQAVGVSLAILGAVLTSFKLHDLMKLKLRNLATGVEYAIITLLAWGMLFAFIDVLVTELSWFLPVFFIKTVAVFYILTFSSVTKRSISFPKNVALFIILIGVFDFVGFLSYGIGLAYEYATIVAPIASTSPLVTIILARIFFKESLEMNQKIGIVSALIGLVLLSI